MQRYIIIRMYRTEEISGDVHDLSIEDCSRRAEELRGWARGLKAALFLATWEAILHSAMPLRKLNTISR